MLNSLLAFYGSRPEVAWALTVAILFFVAAGLVVLAELRRRWRDEDERARDAMVRSASQVPPPQTWPRPVGPKGFHRNGGGTAA